jgi:hypothetical protein
VRGLQASVASRLTTLGALGTNPLAQLPLFRALGTKEADKRHRLYDGGHRNLVTRPDLIGEILDSFDSLSRSDAVAVARCRVRRRRTFSA